MARAVACHARPPASRNLLLPSLRPAYRFHCRERGILQVSSLPASATQRQERQAPGKAQKGDTILVMTTPFNLAQLATYAQAKELATKLSTGIIIVGGGVRPGTDENPGSVKPGIYRPVWEQTPWSVEAHFFNEQTGEKFYFLHFRFMNGAEGMNVGLIQDKFRRYPSSPLYVLSQLAEEAARIVAA